MQRRVKLLTAALALTSAACAGGGGSGGVGPVSPPPPTPAPPASPPPSTVPPAAFYENVEYNRDYSKALIHASAAYAAGGTGEGIVIAVIDSGIDLQHAEFAGGKVFEAIDIYDGRRWTQQNFTPATTRNHPDDEYGHGTGVASAAAGAKLPQGDPLLSQQQAGMHGVAFDAQILSIRADDPAEGPGKSFDTRAIAAAVDYAVARGAKVINLSLGGDPAADTFLTEALSRATASGALVVAAAGNVDVGEQPKADPDFPANFAATTLARGRALAVGAVDSSSAISVFSNRAGSAQGVFLVAPGEGIVVAQAIDVAVAEDPNGPCQPSLDRCYITGAAGTSFATPQVAGALADLLDAFPAFRNAPENAVTRLLETAHDLGAPGADPVYGRGLIDLAAAFAPAGAQSVTFGGPLAAASVPLELLDLAPSGATGDWVTASGLLRGVVMRDSYDRGYTIDPDAAPAASTLEGAFETAAVSQRLAARTARISTPGGGFAFAAFRAPDDANVAHPNLATDEMLTPELSLTVREGPLAFAMGRGFSAPASVGGGEAATLTPTAVSGAMAALAGAGDWASIGYDRGRWTLGVRASGDAGRGFSAASFTRHFGAHEAGLELGSAHEDESALGGALGSRLGGTDRADSTFAALAWRGPVGGGFTGSARVEVARAALDMPAYVRVVDDPVASAWTVSLERPLARGLDWGLALAQPLRAETGTVALTVPVGVTETNASIYEQRTAALTPSGREIDLETSLRFGLGRDAEGRIALKVADDPAHVAGAEPEAAVWAGVRWRM